MTDNNLRVVITAETQALQTELRRTEQTIQQLNARLVAVGQNGAGFAQLQNQIRQAETEAGRLRQAISTMPSAPSNLRTSFSEAIGSASSLSAGVSTLGSTVGALINPVTLATASIAAMGAAGFKAANEYAKFEQQITRFSAFNSLNAQQTADFAQKVQGLSSQFSQFSGTEMASALVEISKAGVSASDAIELMPTAINFALASEEGLASSSEKLLGILNGFGAGIGEAAHYADVLAQSAKDSAIGVNDIALTMSYVAPVASSAGQSIEEMAGIIAILGNAGIKGEKAGTALRGALASLTNPTGQTLDAMVALGLSIQDTEGNMLPLSDIIDQVREKTENMTEVQKNQYVAQIAGNEGLSAFSVLLNKSPEEIQAVIDKYKTLDGVNADLANRMNQGLIPAWNNLTHAMGTTFANFGGWISQAMQLANAMQILTAVINGFNADGISGAFKAGKEKKQDLEYQKIQQSGLIEGTDLKTGNLKINQAKKEELRRKSTSFLTGLTPEGIEARKTLNKLKDKGFIESYKREKATLQAESKKKAQEKQAVSEGRASMLGGAQEREQRKAYNKSKGYKDSQLSSEGRVLGKPEQADPAKEKKGGGKKGPSAESLAKKADKAMDSAKDLEIAKEKLKLALEEAEANNKLRDIKTNIGTIESDLVKTKQDLKTKDTQLDSSNNQIDLGNQILDLEKQKVESKFKNKQITEEQKIAQIAQLDKQKTENDYAKDLNEIKSKGLTIDGKKAENQADILKKEQLIKQNAIEEAKAKKEVDSAKFAVDKQKEAVGKAKTEEDKVKLQIELQKLEVVYTNVQQKLADLLNKNAGEVSKATQEIANNQAEIANLESSLTSQKSLASSTRDNKISEIDMSSQSELDDKAQERAKTMQEALKTGGKEIYDEIKGAFDDGKITLEEAFKIGETVFAKLGDIFKAGSGGEGGGGLGSLFGMFKGFGGDKKSGGGGSDGGYFDGSKWFDKVGGSEILNPNAGGGAGGGFMSMIGGASPVGAIFSGLSTAVSIGTTVFGLFKGLKEKQKAKKDAKIKEDYEKMVQEFEISFRAIEKAIALRLEGVNDQLKDFSKKASRVISEGNYSIGKLDLNTSLLSIQKAIAINETSIIDYGKNSADQIRVINAQINGGLASDREQKIAALLAFRQKLSVLAGDASDATQESMFEKIRDIDNNKLPQIYEDYRLQMKAFTEQREDLLQNSFDQIRDLNDQIGKYAEQIGSSVLGFNLDVDFSSYNKAVRGIGQAVADVIKRGSDLLEGGFDQSKVKTLIENNLKDIQETELGNLDTAVNTAVENRKTWLSDRIKQLSDAIAGITEKFGFKKADTADKEIERAYKDFQKERMLQEADLMKQQHEAIKNQASGQAIFNDTVAQQMGIVQQKAIAGSTQEYYKVVASSITPSADGLKQASSILSQAMSAALDASLQNIVKGIR